MNHIRFVIPIELNGTQERADLVVPDATILSGITVEWGIHVGDEVVEPRHDVLPKVFGVIGARVASAGAELQVDVKNQHKK